MILGMERAIWWVLVLAACAGPRPPAARGSVPAPAALAAPAKPGEPAEPAVAPAAVTTPAPTTPEAPVPDSHPAGAHCLYVGPNHDVVRCYWKREDCERQIAFNTDSGLTRIQECKAVAEPSCFQLGEGGEMCYPTAAECDRVDASMKQRNRQTSGCAAKTGP